jgi:hypothetical protein
MTLDCDGKQRCDSLKNQRIFEERLNNKGCLMKIVEYNKSQDIVVEFQDEYKARVHTAYCFFLSGEVKNPYYPSILGVGIVGDKCQTHNGKRPTKEYYAWKNMLCRCFDENEKKRHKEYQNVTCCTEWLLFENFYEWLHSQENFNKWINENGWDIDKDILFKGNNIYSPETCCLVPTRVNKVFSIHADRRGDYPIGVSKHGNSFKARHGKTTIGTYKSPELAFQAYKKYKEVYIKQIAEQELFVGNITQRCYKAIMCYKVEITD